MLDQSDNAFSIEREARLHRQAAGTSGVPNLESLTFNGCGGLEHRRDLNVHSVLLVD